MRPATGSAPEDYVMSAPACASVAIDEWMDGLELSMGDCALSDGRQIVAVEIGDKVGHEPRN